LDLGVAFLPSFAGQICRRKSAAQGQRNHLKNAILNLVSSFFHFEIYFVGGRQDGLHFSTH
jgi:hypothetical protein